ncbi:MAG: STAS domain-containing protein [Phycisphaerales bacterium]|nr:STAS domain-containing protein [Phycisphaerales bacterium]
MPTDWSDDIVICELADEPAFSDELNGLIDRLDESDVCPHIVLTFSNVTYISSSDISLILRLRKITTDADRALVLCAVSDDVMHVLRLTGLDRIMRFTADPMTALAAIQLEDAEG